MMILRPTRKSIITKAPCCNGCGSGKPCCGKKKRTKTKHRPAFERRGDIWLPRPNLSTPMLLAREVGMEPFWWRPMLAQQFDMSCMPCCATGCCADIPSNIVAFVGALAQCCGATVTIAMSKTGDFVWESGSTITTNPCFNPMEATFTCFDTSDPPTVQITLRHRGNFGACDQSYDSGVIVGSCGSPFGYVEWDNTDDANCCEEGGDEVIDVEIRT